MLLRPHLTGATTTSLTYAGQVGGGGVLSLGLAPRGSRLGLFECPEASPRPLPSPAPGTLVALLPSPPPTLLVLALLEPTPLPAPLPNPCPAPAAPPT